ncbi:OLC1v1013266C1 [Oldenlandia corymbosa var. corymbosa]|uniref:OLC1v1013266C1 n=1 Tax=Oldenlandia corymbosa var. corymbosa TaxID=529605 RepID=A0AAV1DYL5_OLDCO|nr:OLC1v1013266C1 [Oldenlandia corymbosa var. corymbosa]
MRHELIKDEATSPALFHRIEAIAAERIGSAQPGPDSAQIPLVKQIPAHFKVIHGVTEAVGAVLDDLGFRAWVEPGRGVHYHRRSALNLLSHVKGRVNCVQRRVVEVRRAFHDFGAQSLAGCRFAKRADHYRWSIAGSRHLGQEEKENV